MVKLPICQAPVQIHPNPTRWLSDGDARDWIARIIARWAVDMTVEEALEELVKFLGARMAPSLNACPAGDPCPATGCPACCPKYDPCGEPGCRSCGGSYEIRE